MSSALHRTPANAPPRLSEKGRQQHVVDTVYPAGDSRLEKADGAPTIHLLRRTLTATFTDDARPASDVS